MWNSFESDGPLLATDRVFLTLAFGATRYINMAKALGRSLERHQPEIPRAIVTDACDDPDLKRLFDYVLPYEPRYGPCVRQKLYLDQYTPFDRTLFIDSDCLVIRPIDHLWHGFEGKIFSAQGTRILRRGERDSYLDIDKTLEYFGLTTINKFNGGIYYLERGVLCNSFFRDVRWLASRYRTFCHSAFRGSGPADESIYAVAMALHGLEMTTFGNAGMFTPNKAQGRVHVDVLDGIATFNKNGRRVAPDIVHFCGSWAATTLYQRQRIALGHHERDLSPSSFMRRVGIDIVTTWLAFEAKIRYKAIENKRIFRRHVESGDAHAHDIE